MNPNQKPNRLIHSKSPYLLQHAYNPVNWHEWTDEALEVAKQENKPIFVSIGYSTCHWCHVMAHESFEDEETARILNEGYVAIKVDREERPDIDAVYMKVCQTLTGQGGWPLNVFLTPDQKPFFAGTYFPKQSIYGRPGFKDVLVSLKQLYDENPNKIERLGNQIIETLSEKTKKNMPLTEDILDAAFSQLLQNFDPENGGFGHAPKFPAPHQLMFLLRYARSRKNGQAIEIIRKTLDAIAAGGIHDHIGGGFARYSTDEKWLVPHFEKMLYDQALLAMAYTEAFQVTRDPSYEKTVEDIFAYCKRELRDPEGGFYSAEDADSEGVEGKYYVWTPEEVENVLGEEQGKLFSQTFHITAEGNFEGKNIPHLIGTDFAGLAKQSSASEKELMQALAKARASLLVTRNHRVHPYKDDKILTSWNALMILALAKAGAALHKYNYVNLAKSAFLFIENHLIQDGKLMARFRDGETKYAAYLDDYAFLSLACEALYEATLNPVYLKKMKHYADEMIMQFWIKPDGGFSLYNQKETQLIIQPKEAYDGAIPSGNSAAAYVLLRLSERTGDSRYGHDVEKVFSAFAQEISAYPSGYTFMLTALLFQASVPKELVVLKGEKGDSFEDAVQTLGTLFLPEVILFAGDQKNMKTMNENLNIYSPIGGRTTYFLCEGFVCHLPVVHLKQLLGQLSGANPS